MLVWFNNRIGSTRHFGWWRLVMLFITTVTLGILGLMSAYASPSAVTWPPITLRLLENGFDNPIDVTSANDGTGRLFVLERGGVVYIVQDGERLATPFLDIVDRAWDECSECGLLGIAFPPNFAEVGYFFVNYTSTTDQALPDTDDPNTPHDTVIARFHVTGNPNIADATSEERIIAINKPESNHNGGHILFGPGDYLYIGTGDGGGGGDQFQNAQNPGSLLGKILRIAVGATLTYTIPADNPFIDTEGYRDEIWATGLRNPWRFNFDRITSDLYIADVGQGDFEEINYVAAGSLEDGGQNYGWPIVEGNNCYPPGGGQNCDRTGLTAPVVAYDHSLGDCSVTGGYVYRPPLPNQAPIYLYADFCSGRVWGMQRDGANWATLELREPTFQISSFGEDEAGNVYVVNYGGAIYQITSPEPSSYIPNLSKAE